MAKVVIPTFDALMNPLIQALKELGGSGTIEEIESKVSEIAGITDEQLEILHDPDKSTQTEVDYRLAWTRTYLKKYGILENSGRGVWALTAKGADLERVDPQAVKRFVRAQDKKTQKIETRIEEENGEVTWREELLATLLKMPSDAFERLVQRVLRESGFIQVEVTGRSGDGGIDGKGLLRIGGLLSFRVLFQCKRYQGSVSASQIRDFRGAMMGRADKALFVTTGRFTRDAMTEAIRDGAIAIDLIDGDNLLDLLKNLGLGVQSQKIEVEQITVDNDWFSNL